MRYRPYIFAALLALIMPQAALANDANEDLYAQHVAPFLDEQTYAVIHAKLTAEDIKGVLNYAVDNLQVPMPDEQRKMAPIAIDGFFGTAAMLMGEPSEGFALEGFVILTTADIPEPYPIFVFPMPDEANAESLNDFLENSPFIQSFGDLNSSLSGGSLALEMSRAGAISQRLESMEPFARPDILALLRQSNEGNVRFVFSPPPYWRKVIADLNPTLPKVWGGGPGTSLSEGVQSLTVDLSISEKPWGKATVVSSSPEHAASFVATYQAFLGWVGEQRDTQRILSPEEYEQLKQLLMPTTDGVVTTLEINEKNGKLGHLVEMIKGLIEAERTDRASLDAVEKMRRLVVAFLDERNTLRLWREQSFTDDEGRLCVSWRVRLLPWIGNCGEVGNKLHADKPWDGEHNKPLLDQMPPIFSQSPGEQAEAPLEPGMTRFVIVDDPVTFFSAQQHGGDGSGAPNPVRPMFVQVNRESAVPWTKPDVLELDPDAIEELFNMIRGQETLVVAYSDGHVERRSVPENVEELRELLRSAETAAK